MNSKDAVATRGAVDSAHVARVVRQAFSRYVNLPIEEIFDADMTLAEVVARSDKLHNSVDLMEAFAKTANVIKSETGMRVKLPVFLSDTPVSAVMQALLQQVDVPTSAS